MSDAILKALDEIKQKHGDAAVALKAVQEKHSEFEKGQKDVLEGMTKAAKDAENAIAQIQELKQSISAVEQTAKWIEKTVARTGDVAADAEAEHKAHQATCRYLRTGEEMPDDVKQSIVLGMTEKMFHGLNDEEKAHQVKTLMAGVGEDGGYFIRPERSAQMIKRIFETSPLRRFANVVTTGSDVLEMIIDDEEGVSGGWVGETQTRGDTGTPQIGLLKIPVHEQYAQPLATQKMLDDAGFDIEAWLAGKTTGVMIRKENLAFVSGDGSQKPKGFLSYPAWASAGVYERGKIEQINSGSSGAFTGDGLKKLQNSLIEDYQMNAVFAIKRDSFYNIITLKDLDNNYIFQSQFLRDRDEMRLLGKEVVFMHDIPAVGAAALAAVYGDFGQGYTIVDRIGFRVIRDPYTSKPYVKFYTTKRVGGAVTNYEALKIQKLSA